MKLPSLGKFFLLQKVTIHSLGIAAGWFTGAMPCLCLVQLSRAASLKFIFVHPLDFYVHGIIFLTLNSLKQTRLWGTFLAVKFWLWTIVKKTPFSCAHKQLLKRMRFAFSKSMRIKTKAAWAHRKVSFFWWGQNKTLQQKWHQRLRQCFKNRI